VKGSLFIEFVHTMVKTRDVRTRRTLPLTDGRTPDRYITLFPLIIFFLIFRFWAVR